MAPDSAVTSLQQAWDYRAILWGGLITGGMDLTAAFLTSAARGVGAVRVLQYIASGVLGPGSFKLGPRSAALGVFFHFLIAFTACAAFYAVSRGLSFLTEQAIVSGMLYGLLVYAFMNLIVLPLSAVTRPRFSVVFLIVGLVVHMLCVGLPISLSIRWFAK
jgi:hypothetical protein